MQLTSSKSVLEDLLKAQKLQHGKVDSWVESETTLVWTKSRVELHTVSAVDLSLEFVVLPHNSELDDSLWDGNDLEGSLVFGLLFEEGGVFEGGDKLCKIYMLVSVHNK